MPSTVAEDLYQGMDAIVQLSGPSGPITVGGFQTVRFSLSHAPVMYRGAERAVGPAAAGQAERERHREPRLAGRGA
jgi:hypothetical protein